jgi:hypothetical protein
MEARWDLHVSLLLPQHPCDCLLDAAKDAVIAGASPSRARLARANLREEHLPSLHIHSPGIPGS